MPSRRAWFHTIDLGNGIITPGIDASAQKLAGIRMPESCAGMSVLDIGAFDGFFPLKPSAAALGEWCLGPHVLVWAGGVGQGRALPRETHLGIPSAGSHARVEDLDAAVLGTFDLVLSVEAMLKEVGFASVETLPQWAPLHQSFHAHG